MTLRKRALLRCFIVSVFASISTVIAGGAEDRYEDDDAQSRASVIWSVDPQTLVDGIPEALEAMEIPQVHTVHSAQDEDWLVFYAEGEVWHEARVDPQSVVLDLRLELYDADGVLLKYADQYFAGEREYLDYFLAGESKILWLRVVAYDYVEDGLSQRYGISVYRPELTFPGFLYGTVAKAAGGEPLAGVQITTSRGSGAISLPNGAYLLPHSAGQFEVTAALTEVGYQPTSQTVVLQELTYTEQNFALEAAGGELPPGEDTTSGVVNISTRGMVDGGHPMHGGFVIRGAAKHVLVKGLGPTLGDRGVSGFLSDPLLELYSGQDIITTSDNWRELGGCGGNSLDPNHDVESCIRRTLPPGAYTAVLHGVGGTSGRSIVSVNDLGGEGSIVNLSTRGTVTPGVEYLTGGFVIKDRNSRVLVKARGPSLADNGVENSLPDPTLALYSGSTEIASNDSWRAGSCGGTGLEPSYDNEPCLLMTLAPGAYTAIVRSATGAAGAAIVSVNTIGN